MKLTVISTVPLKFTPVQNGTNKLICCNNKRMGSVQCPGWQETNNQTLTAQQNGIHFVHALVGLFWGRGVCY